MKSARSPSATADASCSRPSPTGRRSSLRPTGRSVRPSPARSAEATSPSNGAFAAAPLTGGAVDVADIATGARVVLQTGTGISLASVSFGPTADVIVARDAAGDVHVVRCEICASTTSCWRLRTLGWRCSRGSKRSARRSSPPPSAAGGRLHRLQRLGSGGPRSPASPASRTASQSGCSPSAMSPTTAADPSAQLDAAITVGADGVVRELAVTWPGWTYAVSTRGSAPPPLQRRPKRPAAPAGGRRRLDARRGGGTLG